VLARQFEAAGICSVLVTNMPVWSERIGVPRTVAVEFPYGHAFGRPGDDAMQMRVIEAALGLLESAISPGEVVAMDVEWPQSLDEAKRDWQPLEPSPIVARMIAQRRRQAEQERRQTENSGP
jgi:hypothetical protein